MINPKSIAVVDLFAGPGGLGEGFTSISDSHSGHPFEIAISVEMDLQAHRTLRLRSFYRQYRQLNRTVPDSYYKVLRGDILAEGLETRCPKMWMRAKDEAFLGRLGVPEDDDNFDLKLAQLGLTKRNQPVVLIGGPPCQAYSLVGRARNKGISGYRAEEDHRHLLYKEYLRIISNVWPVAFVMENVKGILSSKINSDKIFPRILEDLHDPSQALVKSVRSPANRRYKLLPITLDVSGSPKLFDSYSDDPSRFIVRCEDHGIPQRRHRVFIIGIREDIKCDLSPLTHDPQQRTVRDAIGDLPPLLAGVSRRGGINMNVAEALSQKITSELLDEITSASNRSVTQRCRKATKEIAKSNYTSGSNYIPTLLPDKSDTLSQWYHDKRLEGVCNHMAKAHMPSDLVRYLFASSFAESLDYSPKLSEFPNSLLPAHKNANPTSGKPAIFNDRFRVQLWDSPATTVTSHLAKDGHYFIHPDPFQCRSLSVREAARIQTFPDNYYFCGPRTSQYQQVGNAVPPLIANKIAKCLFHGLKSAGI